MKLKWIKPEIQDLSVKDTKSGKTLANTPDGDPWQDGGGYWHQDIGSS